MTDHLPERHRVSNARRPQSIRATFAQSGRHSPAGDQPRRRRRRRRLGRRLGPWVYWALVSGSAGPRCGGRHEPWAPAPPAGWLPRLQARQQDNHSLPPTLHLFQNLPPKGRSREERTAGNFFRGLVRLQQIEGGTNYGGWGREDGERCRREEEVAVVGVAGIAKGNPSLSSYLPSTTITLYHQPLYIQSKHQTRQFQKKPEAAKS